MSNTQKKLHHIALYVLAFAVSGAVAWAATPLLPGTSNFKPALPAPHYSTVQPAYFTAANTVATLVSPYVEFFPAPGITGALTSTVYRDPSTGFLGFKYKYTSTASTVSKPVIRSTIGGGGFPWLGAKYVDAGSEGIG